MRTFIENLDENTIRIKQSLQTKQLLQFFLQKGEKTIPELCEFSGVSIPTATKIVNDLLSEKIIIETGKRESSGGRRPSVFGLNADMGFIIGVELLTKSFRMSIVNLNHEVIFEYETETFDLTQRDQAFDFLVKTVPNIIKKRDIPYTKILGIGIGMAGVIDQQRGISYSYLNYDTPLDILLSKEWDLPVYIDNDAHLMTLGEQTFGLAKDKQNVLYVNLSRGLGVGLISNALIHTGKSGFAGEFGHIPFVPNGKDCICGKKGCFETIVSGGALEDRYHALVGQEKHYRDIINLARAGDKMALKALSEMTEKLGEGLSILVQIFNPEMIIIGGRFSSVGEMMKYAIIRGLSLYCLPRSVADCDVQVSSIGEKATMLGAFALVMENIFQKKNTPVLQREAFARVN
jgi:transcriptional regulator of PTS gene